MGLNSFWTCSHKHGFLRKHREGFFSCCEILEVTHFAKIYSTRDDRQGKNKSAKLDEDNKFSKDEKTGTCWELVYRQNVTGPESFCFNPFWFTFWTFLIKFLLSVNDINISNVHEGFLLFTEFVSLKMYCVCCHLITFRLRWTEKYRWEREKERHRQERKRKKRWTWGMSGW